RRLGRTTSAPDLANLCSLLQRHQNALVAGQRCTGLSSHSAYRNHQLTRDPWWTASLLRSDLVFRYTHVRSERAQHELRRQNHCHQQEGVEKIARKRRRIPSCNEVLQRE